MNSQVKLHLDLESELSAGPWFLGERFSAADIMMSFPLEAARVRGGLDATRPNLFAFVERKNHIWPTLAPEGAVRPGLPPELQGHC